MTAADAIRERLATVSTPMLEGLVQGLRHRAVLDMKANKSDEARIAYTVAAAELARRRGEL